MDGLFAYDGPGSARDPASSNATSGISTGGGTLAGNTHDSAPLAVRMRPRTLDELV
ncbi:MAG: replication-associated recombination protein, partial [Marmoricola sp.]|nr:replication-associated recombination protein [Marmoricola sp.]